MPLPSRRSPSRSVSPPPPASPSLSVSWWKAAAERRSRGGSSSSLREDPQKVLLVYPPGQPDSVTLRAVDVDRLAPGEFLNDALIDFYLKHLWYQDFDDVARRRFFLFNTFFNKRLVREIFPWTEAHDSRQQPPSKLVKWTQGVDVFTKDFIFVPVNRAAHWFLVVICFPGDVAQELLRRLRAGRSKRPALGGALPRAPKRRLCAPVDSSSGEEDGTGGGGEVQLIDDNDDHDHAASRNAVEEVETRHNRGCILTFDSLGGGSRKKLAQMLEGWLSLEWADKHKEQPALNFDGEFTMFAPHCASQSNYSDCGVFLCRFVRELIANADSQDAQRFFTYVNSVPSCRRWDTSAWFGQSDITKMRTQEFHQLIDRQVALQAQAAEVDSR